MSGSRYDTNFNIDGLDRSLREGSFREDFESEHESVTWQIAESTKRGAERSPTGDSKFGCSNSRKSEFEKSRYKSRSSEKPAKEKEKKIPVSKRSSSLYYDWRAKLRKSACNCGLRRLAIICDRRGKGVRSEGRKPVGSSIVKCSSEIVIGAPIDRPKACSSRETSRAAPLHLRLTL